MVDTPEPKPIPVSTSQRMGELAETIYERVEDAILGPTEVPSAFNLGDFMLIVIITICIGALGPTLLSVLGMLALVTLVVRLLQRRMRR